MDPVSATILSLINIGITAMQQAQQLKTRQANGEDVTAADLDAAHAETQRLMAEGDALRSTPRGG